jgi:integrase
MARIRSDVDPRSRERQKGSRLKQAVVVRNGLMVALLAFCPVRLRNFASLKIGQTFVRQAGEWWIVLEDTKSGTPDHRPVDHALSNDIEAYLNVYRPVLLAHSPYGLDSTLQVTGLGTKEVCALWLGRLWQPFDLQRRGKTHH